MSSTATLGVPAALGEPAREPARLALLDELLAEQRRMTLVERFSHQHDCDPSPAQAKFYRDLIPLSAPRPGEQYAFEVDLDSCSGCKACVAACHALNGLEDDESWRGVGLLTGGSTQLPVIQHITTACHHCVDPACLEGCPVNAYVKDPGTGIVRHLDDQCIGCQYCVLKCPYDVPKYSYEKGIVRKCDMCQGRLAVGEAPACVQSCPNQAIRITIVNQQAVREESETSLFLPGTADPSYTLPTTVYKTARPLPRNLLPADYFSAAPQHAHVPLVVMLVLTQMSVGAFAVEQVVSQLVSKGDQGLVAQLRPVHLLASFGLGVLGLIASLFHLGRPWYAFRAIIGLRSSWLSREILGFGVFAGLASLYAGLPWMSHAGIQLSPTMLFCLGWSVVLSGLAGVFCSVMVYDSTRRPLWHWSKTGCRFLLTCVLLGLPTSLLIAFVAEAFTHAGTVERIMSDFGANLCAALVIVATLKLLFEAAIFTHLFDKQLTPLKRSAALLSGELARRASQRYACGILGGVVLPGLLFLSQHFSVKQPLPAGMVVGAVIFSLAISLLGELLERYLFFAAVIAPKMPGTPAA